MESIDDIKRRLSLKYIGKFGVHGIGVSRSQNIIKVYVDQDSEIESHDILSTVEKEASPCRVLVIREDRPKIASP